MTTKVLITGSSGALGRVITGRLEADPARFQVVAPRRGEAGNRLLDMRAVKQLADSITKHRPDIILHLAATFSNDFDEPYFINVAAALQNLSSVEDDTLSKRALLVVSYAEHGFVKAPENPFAES